MANTDYVANIKKYVADVDEGVVNGIVKHLGIALQSRDASLVSCSDPSELERVKNSFLKKKLGRTESDEELDQAIADVCQKMSGERNKSRVTFYYLLAVNYNQQSLFT
ncbi:MAG TPA: DUF2853 family protein [Gammaproteobacteria bacterium]|nr:DUF2853 family protein [Gammaproteobacteria bacterium]